MSEIPNEYPPLEESKRLIQAMLDNPELKLGELAVEGVEQAIDKHCQPNHAEIGRIAVEQPPIYFSSPKRAMPEDKLQFDDMGTYLERD